MAGNKAVFAVDDMDCAHCAGAIGKALTAAMPGAVFDVDLEHHRVTVDGDAARAAEAIREAGYQPVLLPA